METIDPFLIFVLVVFAIFQIILFFKIWGMTNDSKAIRKIMDRSEKRYYLAHHPEIIGWADDVTEEEKVEALDLIQSLQNNQVIVKKLYNGYMECLSLSYWESGDLKKGHKLIFQLPQ